MLDAGSRSMSRRDHRATKKGRPPRPTVLGVIGELLITAGLFILLFVYGNCIGPILVPTAKLKPTVTPCQKCSTPNTKLGLTATDPTHRCLNTPMMLGDCSMCHDSAPITQCRYLMAPEKKSTPLYWAGIPHHHARAKTAT